MPKQCEHCERTTVKPCGDGAKMTCKYFIAKQDALRHERDMNLRFMKSSDKWPRWPLLPIKQRGEPGFPNVGFLVCGAGPVVHRGAIFAVNPGDRWDSFSREMYESFEALYAAGWRVD